MESGYYQNILKSKEIKDEIQKELETKKIETKIYDTTNINEISLNTKEEQKSNNTNQFGLTHDEEKYNKKSINSKKYQM